MMLAPTESIPALGATSRSHFQSVFQGIDYPVTYEYNQYIQILEHRAGENKIVLNIFIFKIT